MAEYNSRRQSSGKAKAHLVDADDLPEDFVDLTFEGSDGEMLIAEFVKAENPTWTACTCANCF